VAAWVRNECSPSLGLTIGRSASKARLHASAQRLELATLTLVGSADQDVALWGRCATQEPLNAEVFINIRPMDAKASAGKFPVLTLRSRGVQEAGVPGQWYGDGASVLQINGQLVVAAANISDPFARISHEIPPMLSKA
jgi:hypothetical protein